MAQSTYTGGGVGDTDLMSTSAGDLEGNGSTMEEEGIRVVVRVRPLNSQEQGYNYREVVTCQPDGRTLVVGNGAAAAKSFTFSCVLPQSTSQQQMFEGCGATALLDATLEGFATTIFAFGQTGSGKTYTITGPDDVLDGLVPRSVFYLFARVQELTCPEMTFTIQASYCEIYNEQVRDLLNPTSGKLAVRWSEQKGFYVENLFVVYCDTVDDMVAVITEAKKNRSRRGHDINLYSSRSHAIMTIYVRIEGVMEGQSTFKYGQAAIVDLAGSERVNESGATGAGLTEARYINTSLLTLGSCISALGSPKSRDGHIPYRDSELTKLLKNGLGGNGLTLMIACIAPHDLEESVKTLRYAARALRIRNTPIVQMDPREQAIMNLQREVKVLRKENAYLRQSLNVGANVELDKIINGDVSFGGNQSLAIGGGGGGTGGTGGSGSGSGGGVGVGGGPSPSNAGPKFTRHSASRGNGDRKTEPLPSIGSKSARKGSTSSESPRVGPSTDELSRRLTEAEGVIAEYMKENESLKAENREMNVWRRSMGKDYEAVAKENDLLRQRLEALEEAFVDKNGALAISRVIDRGTYVPTGSRASNGRGGADSVKPMASTTATSANTTTTTTRTSSSSGGGTGARAGKGGSPSTGPASAPGGAKGKTSAGSQRSTSSVGGSGGGGGGGGGGRAPSSSSGGGGGGSGGTPSRVDFESGEAARSNAAKLFGSNVVVDEASLDADISALLSANAELRGKLQHMAE